MMNGLEKSDPCEVARKPANKPGQPGAESVERRRGAEGNTVEPHTCRTQCRGSVPQGLDRVWQAAKARKKEVRILHPWPDTRFAVNHPRWEPSARIAPARICAGGAG